MKVFVAREPGNLGKLRTVVTSFPQAWRGTVLDVGCRQGLLKAELRNAGIRVIGMDLHPPADLRADAQLLPFRSNSIDVIVALDVLEHTEDIHRAFAEMCRVASNSLVISLPNAYDFLSRIKFLLGKPLSAKYGLPVVPPTDRHRWLFSFLEAKRFVETVAIQYGYRVILDGALIGPRRKRVIGEFLVHLFPNLLAPHYICWLRVTAR